MSENAGDTSQRHPHQNVLSVEHCRQQCLTTQATELHCGGRHAKNSSTLWDRLEMFYCGVMRHFCQTGKKLYHNLILVHLFVLVVDFTFLTKGPLLTIVHLLPVIHAQKQRGKPSVKGGHGQRFGNML
jgi:hypothetical protein